MDHSLFASLATIISVVVLFSLLMRLLRQPAIIGYILSGVLLSPYGTNLVHSTHNLEIFSQMGVSFLLFMVGLSLNPKTARDVGKVAVLTGLGQVLFTSVIGFCIGKVLGFPTVTSIYLAIALTFSSTIIIMKLLSDKGDLESLYGRIATGFLIVQDIIAMLLLVGVTALSAGGTITTILQTTVAQLVGLGALLAICARFLLPWLLKQVAQSQELLLLFSIAWCLMVASVFDLVGLSIEMGALAAGIVLSLSPFRYELAAKLRPLRDFFIVLFFVLLGTHMQFTNLSEQLLPILVFSAYILIGNPLIMIIIMSILGYSKRNSLKAGLTVAQISEFSFILITLAIRIGHVPAETLSLVTFIGLITIAGSTYFILYSEALVRILSKPLSLIERKNPIDTSSDHKKAASILLLGYERIGLDVINALQKTKKTFTVIDYNPETIKTLAQKNIDCLYGDLADTEFLQDLNFADAKMVVATIRDFDTSVLIVRRVRSVNNKAIVVVLAQQVDEALYLYELGASYVITPQFLSGYHTSMLIQEFGFDMKKFLLEQTKHLAHLRDLACKQNDKFCVRL